MAAMLYFAAVFVNCLLFAPVVKASTQTFRFVNTGLDNVIFTSSVLFESESRSVLDCGGQCSSEAWCVTFTHVTGSSSGSCRGHSETFTSTSTYAVSVPGAKTFARPSLLPEGCTDYTVLDDVRREMNYNSTITLKDDGLQPGWYRFLLNGTNAVIPTTCVTVYHCGTVASMWLGTIADGALPEAGQQLPANACCGTAWDCCGLHSRQVSVLNCLGYVVYYLYPTLAGLYIGYCATAQN